MAVVAVMAVAAVLSWCGGVPGDEQGNYAG
jgi:hypothetical protein